MNEEVEIIKEFINKTIVGVSILADEIGFVFSDGTAYKMYHEQDCCEGVQVEDIDGDISSLIGSPLLVAEKVTHNNSNPAGVPRLGNDESFTWTFYKLSTQLSSVTIRWYGQSNGYYSEEVDIRKVDL